MTAAEPFLLPKKKIKNKKCANFSSWRLWISILSIIVCMFFVNSRLEPPQPYQWKKTQNFYGRTRGQKQNKPRSPCVSSYYSSYQLKCRNYYYSPKKVKENKKNNLKKENIFLALVVLNSFFLAFIFNFFWKLKIFFISLYFNSHICVLEFDFYFLLPYK